MSNRRPSVGAVAFATSVCLCASLHAQPADVPTPGSSPAAPESSPAVPGSAPAPAAPQVAPASPDAAPTLPEINVTAKRAAPSVQSPKPGAPGTHAAPTVRVARPANTARTRLVVSPRPPGPTAPTPPAAPVQGSAGGLGNGVPPVVAKFQLPQQSFSITAKEIEQTINLKDPEDAVKYMPSLFVRKRNDGDNQAVLATRTWGLNSSARSLIYLDDLLISALIGNNNTGAAPKWNLVPPEAIARVDFLDGPYAAAYPGNSIGGVLLITSKMPDKFEATLKETVSVQPWQQYGTHNTYSSNQTSMSVGDRYGDFAWLFSAYYLDAYAQPLTYTTVSAPPAGTTGTFLALNKQGVVADVVGTGALIHNDQKAANLKLTYDVLPGVTASYSLGIWNNVQNSDPQTYLTSTKTGAPTFGGVSSFASNEYTWNQTHMSNAASFKSDTRGVFDFDFSASSYNYLQDIMLNPYTVTPTGVGYSQNGKITRNDGTNWQNADAKGIWRPGGRESAHEVSFGIHGDRYNLDNPVYASSAWNAPVYTGQIYSDGIGETRTGALWMQDAWRIFPNLKLTLGGRLETWRALDGYNLGTTANAAGVILSTVAVNQPDLNSSNFSPKASLSYDLDKDWNVTVNFGEAWRYPTVTELYQNITVNGVATFANPLLKPEQDFSGEVNIERKWFDGRARLTLFDERVNEALISQTSLVTSPTTGVQTPTTTISNVQAIGMKGVELAAEKDNMFIDKLQLFGSMTWVDSRILADPTWAGLNPLTNRPDNVVGNRVPYVPDWRMKFGFTYRPVENWSWTVAGRYSGKQYSTLDNTDVVGHVYGAFDRYTVIDTKIHYEATENFMFDFGIDNVFNQYYFLFHPFPGRTYVIAAKYRF
jgi:iron complex outermembrane receptor protein